MRQKIHFTGKNLNDVFFLPCVGGMPKTEGGKPFLILRAEYMSDRSCFADIGDWLVERDDGMWHIEEGGEE